TRAVTLDPAAGTHEHGDTAKTRYTAPDQTHETSETALVDPYGDYSPAEADQGYNQWAEPGHQWAEPGDQWADPGQPQEYGAAPGYAAPQHYPAAPAGYPPQQSAGYPAPEHRPTPPPAPTKKLSNRSTVKGLLWTAIITALVIAIGLGGWWLTSGRYGQIPSVIGLDRETAVVKVEDAGFVSQVAEQFSADHPAKEVMGTDPPSGERAPKGSQVSVLVSLGAPTVPIPGETDTAETYSAKLTSRNLVAEIGEEVYSDDAEKGTVAEVPPSPGSEVRTGCTVTIHVTRGPRPVRVPGVEGQKLDRAKKTLEAA